MLRHAQHLVAFLHNLPQKNHGPFQPSNKSQAGKTGRAFAGWQGAQAAVGGPGRWVPASSGGVYIYICRGLDVLRVKADGGTSDFICVELDAVHLLRHLKRTEAALTSDLKTNQNLNTIKDGLTL